MYKSSKFDETASGGTQVVLSTTIAIIKNKIVARKDKNTETAVQ